MPGEDEAPQHHLCTESLGSQGEKGERNREESQDAQGGHARRQESEKLQATAPGQVGSVRKLVVHLPTEAAGGLTSLSHGLNRLEARWNVTCPPIS